MTKIKQSSSWKMSHPNQTKPPGKVAVNPIESRHPNKAAVELDKVAHERNKAAVASRKIKLPRTHKPPSIWAGRRQTKLSRRRTLKLSDDPNKASFKSLTNQLSNEPLPYETPPTSNSYSVEWLSSRVTDEATRRRCRTHPPGSQVGDDFKLQKSLDAADVF